MNASSTRYSRLEILILVGAIIAIDPFLNIVAADGADISMIRMRLNTPAYRNAATQIIIDEVNQFCREVKLPERLPISTNDLTEASITAPLMSDSAGMLGTISTTNYHYFASRNNKLSSVVRNFGPSDALRAAYLDDLKRRYLWPNTSVDTNAAYKLATQWLAAASVDVRALERDSQVEIREWNVGNQFVPLYWVRWIQPFARRGNFLMPIKSTDIVASIELVEPEHLLLQMHVEKPQYINRHRLVVPNREELLQQTDNPQLREMWFTTKAYKAAALQAMLSDVNRVCTDLHLPEKLPVETGDLTEIRIETPFFSDHQHRFATICTSNYVYAANIGNKLCYINKNFREQDESRFLLGIKSRYTASMSEANTLQAYVIATQWLASASIDVAALGRDCHVESTPWSLDKNQCVPLYTFRWIRGQEEEIATVEVLEPERLLLKLWVENADYIKRRSLALPNRESLLAQTNAPLSHAQ